MNRCMYERKRKSMSNSINASMRERERENTRVCNGRQGNELPIYRYALYKREKLEKRKQLEQKY